QQLDALARHQLAALCVPLDVLRSAASARDRELLVEGGELLQERRAVRLIALGARVRVATQDVHVGGRVVAQHSGGAPRPRKTRPRTPGDGATSRSEASLGPGGFEAAGSRRCPSADPSFPCAHASRPVFITAAWFRRRVL